MSTPEHPVTEFAFLNLVPPTTLETPKLASGFLDGSIAQSSWSGYPLHFFYSSKKSDSEDEVPSTTIYIISGWASAQAHHEWIASPNNQEIMKFFGDSGMMTVGGVAHLDIDFTKLSFGECAAIVWRKVGVQRDGAGGNTYKDNGTSGLDLIQARTLWSYRGQAVDEGAGDEYELTAYSEGELRDFGEGYTIVRRWAWQAEK